MDAFKEDNNRIVLAADYDYKIFALVINALKDRYQLISFPQNDLLTDYLCQNEVELVILKVSDTDDRAFRLYDVIKKLPVTKPIPVMFLTNSNDRALERRSLSLGVIDYITLPITKELLFRRIDQWIELTRLREERPYADKYQDAVSFSFAELVECRDETTGGHLKNTTRYFDILVHAAIKSETFRDVIKPSDIPVLLRSAHLHDIGKIGISDEVLRKEAALDYNEFEYMKTHTTLGMHTFEKIINETGGTRWLYIAKEMAYCHHERWDGSGYPNGLKGTEIPLYARMLTIADVYDAMTSARAYKEAFSHQKAMGLIIEGKGTCFDPDLVDLFIRVNKKFEEQLLENKKMLVH